MMGNFKIVGKALIATYGPTSTTWLHTDDGIIDRVRMLLHWGDLMDIKGILPDVE